MSLPSKFGSGKSLTRQTKGLRPWCSATRCIRSCRQSRSSSNLYEPDYLISYEPDVPVYDCLNIQLKSYDYTVLEKYQKYVHRYAKILELEVDDGWATPAQNLKVQRYKPRSTVVEAEYNLNEYERNVQVSDVPATTCATLVRVLQSTAPAGVRVRVLEALEEHQEVRYVPDNQLLDLQQQLQDMGGSRADRKKKR